MAQIILAPLLLGGLRPWALAILAILTGIGILAICLHRGPAQMCKHLLYLWLLIAGLIGWSLLQSLQIWPIQAYPFDVARIALVPNGWLGIAVYSIWLGGVITLTALVAQLESRLPILITRTIVVACAVQVVLAASTDLMGWQTTLWFAKQAHLGDWTGSFANRNAFGVLMGFGIVACLFLYQQHRAMSVGKQFDRVGGWLALAIIFAAALVQSHSRLAIVMALVGGVLFIILTPRENAGSFKRLFLISLGCIAVIATTSIASPELFGRFSDLARSDLIQRDDLWATAAQAIAERPVTGWGADSVALVIAHFATADLNANANWFSSHNLWLDGAIMFGIPAMLILIAVLIIVLKTVIATIQQPGTRALVIALAVMGMLGSIGDWVTVMPALILPIVMLGMASFEAAIAARRGAPAPLDHAAQSPAPDPAILR
ncbi:O-antigen ligase family protein [Thalassospira sp. HF15]|uniref:O-antigen ligase family protein n=1 Tax=Thalassospira sp. HF15 TaxID=2722755 RepID=UPI0014317E39|nr:O-antigen ligase family protein [Thalassospira sp. HF15]NIY76907.1 O-antigen ligase family protein [Thalassospira sp. HF15]